MTRLLTIDRLEEGMILGKDIINKRTGVVLITQNTVITKQLIEKLNINEIKVVSIMKEVNLNIQNKSLMASYSKLENKLESLFEDAKLSSEVLVDEVFYEMKNFAEEVSKERNILTQMRMLHNKDDYTFNHSLAVSILSISLGKWAEYSENQIFDLAMAGLFHDIGKLKISDDIINKPARLTDGEYEIIKQHSFYGYEMLLETGRFSEDVLLGVLQHHEKMDGSGYPNKLRGDEIHEYAKIVSICDIYHALISRRTYRDKKSPLKVADYIKGESFYSLDPNLTHIFLDNISKFYVGNRVLLSNGKIGTIIYIHPQDRTKVIVKVGEDFLNFLNPQDVEIVEIII